MRRQLILLASWLCVASAWVLGAGRPPIGERVLEFSGGDHMALGEVSMGEHEVRFGVRNRAGQPVQIAKVSASCTCMQLDFEEGPLEPGEVRECVVNINVQAGNQKTTAVIFDVATPVQERIVKMISYKGIQEDVLDVTVDPPELSLAAGDVRRVTMDCRWVSHGTIEPDQTITAVLERARGVALVGEEEVSRRETELRCRYTLELDARSLDRVSGELTFLAGRPARAEEQGVLDFAVSPSLAIHPGRLLLDGAALTAGENLGRAGIALADGWRVTAVETPAWLAAELDGDSLSVALNEAPPFSRGIGEIKVSAAGPSGANVIRKLKCIFDAREQ